jgi:hypothetical protein
MRGTSRVVLYPGLFVCLGLNLLAISARSQSHNWSYASRWTVQIEKQAGLEMEDLRWMHLHNGHDGADDSPNVTLKVSIFGRNVYEVLEPAQSGVEVRYLVRGTPVSDWLPPPFVFTLNIDDPDLSGIQDGFHDIAVDVRGATANDFKPARAFLHLTRGHNTAFAPTVPIITGTWESESESYFGPGVVYVNPNDRQMIGNPINPRVTPWTLPPHVEDLYQEEMAPRSDLFESIQMWWEDPPHPFKPFVRAFRAKHAEDHRGLRVQASHNRFPMRDGPRGVGWTSPYISGQMDQRGRLFFAEVGGRIARMDPDGEITTIAGWRVKQGRDPIWPTKPLNVVRRNMELRGMWAEGLYPDGDGFRTPLDVAIDPKNPNVLYVVGYEDQCVWKIQILPPYRKNRVIVSVFAGDPNHQAGFQDGSGHNARFNGPASLVFDSVSDALYVADQDNDAIRKITRDRTVTTLYGSPGMAARLQQRGVADVFDQMANRAASQLEVTAQQAQQGIRPEIYVPSVIRVRSDGDLVLLEHGYGALRRINPATGETRKIGEVKQKFRQFDRGWAWFDIDRWGNAGPRDGIYWCKAVGEDVDGETTTRFNEVYAWLPPEGGLSRWIFNRSLIMWPNGWGKALETSPPHYPWLIAVDPRGAVLLAGLGEHGVTRLRKRRPNDPVPTDYYNRYQVGRDLWQSGGTGSRLNSSALKFGWDGHNQLGLPDLWSMRGGETDQQLLDMFEASQEIRNNTTDREKWLEYVRFNRGPIVGSTGKQRQRPLESRNKTEVKATKHAGH